MVQKGDQWGSCAHCGRVLATYHRGPCPNCGKPVAGATGGPSGPSITRSLGTDRRRDFYERHKLIAVLMIVMIFSFPIFGVFTMGVSGLFIGVAGSISAYYVLPYAASKMPGLRRRY